MRNRIVAAVIFSKDRVLIAQRPAKVHLGGLWEFPGGKIEPDESPEEALAREVREELGVGIKIIGNLLRTEYRYDDRTVEIEFFRCQIGDTEPSAIHHEELRWIRPEELRDYSFPPANESIIALLEQERAGSCAE